MRAWALGAALLLPVSGCATAGNFDGAVPSELARPGSCHRMAQPAELYAASDVAPPVSCATAHEAETLAMVRLPGRVAPASGVAGEVCALPVLHDLRDYLGADDLDRHWGIDVWLKVPTKLEWSHGVRTGRCDLVLGGRGPGAPETSRPLRGAMRRTDSASIRHCRFGSLNLTCDRPHLAEEVGGWTGLTGNAFPGARAAARRLRDQCWRNAEQYTGDALERLPVRVTPGTLTAEQWKKGRRDADCWITAKNARATTGTLRADLTKG